MSSINIEDNRVVMLYKQYATDRYRMRMITVSGGVVTPQAVYSTPFNRPVTVDETFVNAGDVVKIPGTTTAFTCYIANDGHIYGLKVDCTTNTLSLIDSTGDLISGISTSSFIKVESIDTNRMLAVLVDCSFVEAILIDISSTPTLIGTKTTIQTGVPIRTTSSSFTVLTTNKAVFNWCQASGNTTFTRRMITVSGSTISVSFDATYSVVWSCLVDPNHNMAIERVSADQILLCYPHNTVFGVMSYITGISSTSPVETSDVIQNTSTNKWGIGAPKQMSVMTSTAPIRIACSYTANNPDTAGQKGFIVGTLS